MVGLGLPPVTVIIYMILLLKVQHALRQKWHTVKCSLVAATDDEWWWLSDSSTVRVPALVSWHGGGLVVGEWKDGQNRVDPSIHLGPQTCASKVAGADLGRHIGKQRLTWVKGTNVSLFQGDSPWLVTPLQDAMHTLLAGWNCWSGGGITLDWAVRLTFAFTGSYINKLFWLLLGIQGQNDFWYQEMQKEKFLLPSLGWFIHYSSHVDIAKRRF